MTTEIRTATDDEQWNDLIEQSPYATPFHRAEALTTLTEHSDGVLHRLVVYEDRAPVGVFPVYEIKKGPMTAAYSPPPGLSVHYLGPLPLDTGESQRNEHPYRHWSFVEPALEWVEAQISPGYWNVRTTIDHDDARPFTVNDYEVEPRYTYVIDLETTPDDLLARFSSDARRNIQKDYDVSYEVTEEGPAAIDRIIEQTRERHEEQDVSFEVPAAFVRDLYDRLPEGTVRPYVCRVDGEFVGGLIDVEDEDRARIWFSTGKTDAPVPVNDLLQWQVCVDAIDRGVPSCDMMGANNERIYPYKAKFAPDIARYHSIKDHSTAARMASKLYS